MSFLALSLVHSYEPAHLLFRKAPHPAATHFCVFPTRTHIVVAHREAYSSPRKDPHRPQAQHAIFIASMPRAMRAPRNEDLNR
jgi:hypothetical protein